MVGWRKRRRLQDVDLQAGSFGYGFSCRKLAKVIKIFRGTSRSEIAHASSGRHKIVTRPSLPSAPKRGRSEEILARADVAMRMGQANEAEQLAASVLKADKGNAVAATIMAHALLALNRADEAVLVLQRSAHRNADSATQTLLAVALAAAGRDNDALAKLQNITSQTAGFPPAFREHTGQLAKLGRIDDAIGIAKRGIELSPDAIELRLDLAALHLRRNNREAARATLLEASAIAPGRPDVLAELGRVLLMDGDYAAAADTFRHALALQPTDAMTRANLAACQLELGQRDAGEASLRSATHGSPQMIGRAIHVLAASSHGRFFLRPSAIMQFLRGGKR